MGPRWTLESRHLRIGLSERAGLCELIDARTGRSFIAPGLHPLYRLALRAESKLSITSLDSEVIDQSRECSESGEILTFTFGSHCVGGRTVDVQVTCRVLLESGDGLIRWRISIRNNTPYAVSHFQFPVVVSPTPLGEHVEDDCFLSANEFMGFARSEAIRSVDIGGQYPGLWTLQMQAYYDETAGLYMATHDDAGYVKSFGKANLDDAIDLSITHHFDETPGMDLEPPYDTVLGVFHGDWHDAADIYKAWAHEQHWCSKKLIQRDDVPSWVKEPRPWLAIISRGNYERLRGTLWSPHSEYPIARFWPAKKVVPMMREYSRIFGTPVVTWMEGWEKIGSPGGPVDIFPPLEGETSLKAAMSRLNRDGNLVFMYLAGFHWCYQRPSVGYDGWDRFEREGRNIAQVQEDGSLNLDTYPDNQKRYAQLCIANDEAQALYMGNFMKLMDLGAVALQLDQQHAWAPVACYNEDHGHPLGHGPWMYRANLDFLKRVRQGAKSRNPDATISVESPCEIWIQEMDVFMHRPNGPSALPLFDYIYHEYIAFYGGDELSPYQHPDVLLITHAELCVYGVQQFVGIGDEELNYEVNPEYPALKLIRNICQAQRSFARDYLVFGQMLRPTELQIAATRVCRWRSSQTVDVPRVMHGTWRSQSGKIGYVLVNWTGCAEKVKLGLISPDGIVSLITPKGTRRVRKNAKAGTVSVTVPARGVVLVEQEGV